MLRSLDMSFNKLQGTIPLGWSALKSLTLLSLVTQQAHREHPWLAWRPSKRLEELSDMSYNQLSGSLPGSSSGLPRGWTRPQLPLRKPPREFLSAALGRTKDC